MNPTESATNNGFCRRFLYFKSNLANLAKIIKDYQGTMNKTFEQECAEGRFEFNPNRSFEERCEIVRRTAITPDMTYEERLAAQRRRYGL